MAYRTRKNRKSMRKRGRKGSVYRRTRRGGHNIGANCPDPNYSIYNTNFLKLFPYKPLK
jgi:hypothetical protein